MTPNRRMTVTVAVACVLVSTAMYPLFDFADWFYAGIGAAAMAAACGALTRLRVLPVARLPGRQRCSASCTTSTWCSRRAIACSGSSRRRPRSGFCGSGSIGIYDAHKFAPPVPRQATGLVLLAAAGIGITAVLTDLIAVRLRSTALAGLPLLVLFTVPVTMNARAAGAPIIVFSLGTAGYLAMLSADGRERIRVWGRLVSLWRTGPYARCRGAARPGTPSQRGAGPGHPRAGRGGAAGRARVGGARAVHPADRARPAPEQAVRHGSGHRRQPAEPAARAGPARRAVADSHAAQETPPTQVLTYTIVPRSVHPAPYLRGWLDTLDRVGLGGTGYTAGEAQATTLQSAPRADRILRRIRR